MFVVNEDNSIYATRGDIVFFNVTAEDKEIKVKHTFQAGDVLRIKIYGKKNAEEVSLQKDFPVTEATESVEIFLTEEDTKIGEVISKPKDYWYEVELNPLTDPQTIIGYDEDGAKVFKLFPEGDDIPEYVPTPEDVAVMDDELDMTSTRPVQNQAIARAVVSLRADFDKTNALTNETAKELSVERSRIDILIAHDNLQISQNLEYLDFITDATKAKIDGRIESDGVHATINVNLREANLIYGGTNMDVFIIPNECRPIDIGLIHTADGMEYRIKYDTTRKSYVLNFSAPSSVTVAPSGAGAVTMTYALGDYELKDIRLGADGKNYPTAGESVREQFRNIYSKYRTIYTKQNIIDNISKWEVQGGTNSFYGEDGRPVFKVQSITGENLTFWAFCFNPFEGDITVGDTVHAEIGFVVDGDKLGGADNSLAKISINNLTEDEQGCVDLRCLDIELGKEYSYEFDFVVTKVPENNYIQARFNALGDTSDFTFTFTRYSINKVVNTEDEDCMTGTRFADTARRAENARFAGVANGLTKEATATLINDTKIAIAASDGLDIVCYGDSLTEGVGVSSTYAYPAVLQRLITDGKTVTNYGLGGKKTAMIAFYQGGLPVYMNPVTLPANAVATDCSLFTQEGYQIVAEDSGGIPGWLNPVYLAGVKSWINENGSHNGYVVQSETDVDVPVKRPIKVNPACMTRDKILVVWAGSNDAPTLDTIDDIINLEKQMITHNGNDKYIVVGLTAKYVMPEVERVNEKLARVFGEHFLDIRRYMVSPIYDKNGDVISCYALEDYNIAPTAQDIADIENGEIPESLRTDSIHGTEEFYDCVAKMVYDKGIDLGYWS